MRLKIGNGSDKACEMFPADFGVIHCSATNEICF